MYGKLKKLSGKRSLQLKAYKLVYVTRDNIKGDPLSKVIYASNIEAARKKGNAFGLIIGITLNEDK
tara:strand:- start:17112 stop:17309 length:198 start_codon:yes stop_codon:yes gene_type:complete